MLFSWDKKSGGHKALTAKDLLEQPVLLELAVRPRTIPAQQTLTTTQVGDVVYGRVNDVWRRVIIIDAAVGQRVRPATYSSRHHRALKRPFFSCRTRRKRRRCTRACGRPAKAS